MKRIVLSVACLGMLSIYSCNKADVAPAAGSGTIAHGTASKFKGTGKVVIWSMWECPYGDGNCIGPIIVTRPKHYDVIKSAAMDGTLGQLLSTNPETYSELTAQADETTLSYIDGVKTEAIGQASKQMRQMHRQIELHLYSAQVN